ncbi:hypothetical protein ACHAW5_004516 [Stephanodiscus triporus]|uniref:Fanconi anemia group D2 protein n=1 Tax=Stephanodiscus triporus TaxID=2934178 RepID=A0ABD3QH21_9STRA
MSGGGGSRKRPSPGRDDDSGGRRRLGPGASSSDWGFGEVLAECGLVEFASPASPALSRPPPLPPQTTTTTTTSSSSSSSSLDDPDRRRLRRRLGCRLESGVSSSTLRSSLTALLSEMSSNGVDRGGGTRIVAESSSLIRALLGVDALQPTLIAALMRTLTEIAVPSVPRDDGDAENDDDDDDVPRLILSNLRWIDHVVDHPSFVGAYVECLTVLSSSSASCEATRGVLLDALAALPDVLGDSIAIRRGGGHGDVGSGKVDGDDDDDDDGDDGDVEDGSSYGGDDPVLSTLQHLRSQDPTLLVPCLDAIGSLPLSDDQVVAATRDALDALANVDQSGLPALVAFLMTRCPVDRGMTTMVVEEMRNLPLGEGESSCLVVESISRGFAHRADVTSAFLRSVRETPNDGRHPPADVWLLACCAYAPHNRQKVKSLFKSKATSGSFTSRMLRESLSGNGVALTSLFGTSLCDLADGLLRVQSSSSSDGAAAGVGGGGGGAACELGVTLYEVLFEEFREPMQRQEIVGSLVTHVGSGVSARSSEVDAALRVFCGIVDGRARGGGGEDGAVALRPFTPFLTSMLDHLHNMTPSQVRRLFLLLFAVGGSDGEGEDAARPMGGATRRTGGACDDVHIVIRKHLSLAPFAMKRILIEGQGSLHGSAAIVTSPVVQEIMDMIRSAYNRCKLTGFSTGTAGSLSARALTTSSFGVAFSDGSAMAFLLEELCHAVRGGKLTKPVLDFIDEVVRADFEDIFVGDFVDEDDDDLQRRGTKGDMQTLEMVPMDSTDLALLDGTSVNAIAPPGELRFGDGNGSVYIKILPLLASYSPTMREFWPIQLSPMFRLIACLSDVDALLSCPVLLPSATSSGIEFEDLGTSKQWVVTASYFFSTCWIRQLINSFILHAADEPGSLPDLPMGPVASFTSSSQELDCVVVRKDIVLRLRALVELEEELRFTSSKCYAFAPPGLDLLPPPKELFGEVRVTNDIENTNNKNSDLETKQDKKTLTAAKNRAVKLKKAKQNYEQKLVNRTFDALRPLDPQVCLALGFAALSVVGSTDTESGISQMQATTCGDLVTTLLLKLLQKVLSESLCEKKGLAYKARMEGNKNVAEDGNDNPYMAPTPVANKASTYEEISLACENNPSKKTFELLDMFLKGDVFASIHEHLAAIAELRCGANRRNDDAETESRLVETARCLFSCVKSIVNGDRKSYGSENKRCRSSTATINKLMGFIADNVNEIVTGAWTGDLEFAMDGVNCMQEIFECSIRISASAESKDEDCDESASSFSTKLSATADKLLRQHWPDDTRMNKENVGRLLSLLVKHSPNRMRTLSHLVCDVLAEVPFLDKGKGVTVFPTCSKVTFASFHSIVLEYIGKELVKLFDSPLGKTKDPNSASAVLESVKEMIGLLQSIFDLTKEHDAKKSILLHQLKFGSRFIETFVLKAMPFCQVHFQPHQDSILDIIRLLRKCSHRLHHIMSHGKREKDVGLAKEAPRAKKALEMFIHKVKILLKKNCCMTAMGTKTLKERDIDGTTLKDEDEPNDQDEGEEDEVESDEDGEEDDSDGSQSDGSEENSEDEYETDDD